MKTEFKILTILFLLTKYFCVHGQITPDMKPPTTRQTVVPQTFQSFSGTVCYTYETRRSSDLNYFLIYDGVPIFSRKEIRSILTDIDTTTIDSIYLKKGPFIKCKKTYDGIFILTTNGSTNAGLKYILAKTNNWMISNPTSDIRINDKKQKLNKSLLRRLTKTDIELIEDIDTVVSDMKTADCNIGELRLKIKS